MIENIKKSTLMNWVFATLLLICIIVIIFVHQFGKKQDSVFLEDYQKYYYAVELLTESKAHEANLIFEQLVISYPNSPYLLWNNGLSLAITGEFEKSIEILQKALKQRPFLVKDPTFTISLGEIYYYNNDFEKAKVYLEYCLNLEITAEQREHIQQLLQDIENKL